MVANGQAGVTMYLYMLVNDVDPHTSTKIGFTSRLLERIRRHNSPRHVEGSDTRARKAAGRWRCIFAAYVPAHRALSGRALARYLELRARRMHCRFRRAVELARHLRLPYLIDAETLSTEKRIVVEERALVDELTHDLNVSRARSDAERTHDVATLIDARDAPHIFDTYTFARTDSPRRQFAVKRRCSVVVEPRVSAPPLARTVPTLDLVHLLN